jgi:hypothetical protein
MRNWASEGIFGGCRGGSASASPQRAVLGEPTKTDAKRRNEAHLRIFRQAPRKRMSTTPSAQEILLEGSVATSTKIRDHQPPSVVVRTPRPPRLRVDSSIGVRGANTIWTRKTRSGHDFPTARNTIYPNDSMGFGKKTRNKKIKLKHEIPISGVKTHHPLRVNFRSAIRMGVRRNSSSLPSFALCKKFGLHPPTPNRSAPPLKLTDLRDQV